MRATPLLAFCILCAGCNCGPDEAKPDGGSQAKARSTFDVDDDGWTIVGDAQSMAVKPTYDGGFISAKDDVTGGTWYFQAPAKYLGDNSALAGAALRFQLKVTPITAAFGNYDVVLQGGGTTLAYDFPNDPGVDWTTFRLTLAPAGWKKAPDPVADEVTAAAFAALPDATPADFAAVLQATTLLRLRGEFNTGSDTGALDTVEWGLR